MTAVAAVADDGHLGADGQADANRFEQPNHHHQRPDHQHELTQVKQRPVPQLGTALPVAQRQEPAEHRRAGKERHLQEPNPDKQPVLRPQRGKRHPSQDERQQDQHHQLAPEQHRRSQPRPRTQQHPATIAQVQVDLGVYHRRAQVDLGRQKAQRLAARLTPGDVDLLAARHKLQGQLAALLLHRTLAAVCRQRFHGRSFGQLEHMLATTARTNPQLQLGIGGTQARSQLQTRQIDRQRRTRLGRRTRHRNAHLFARPRSPHRLARSLGPLGMKRRNAGQLGVKHRADVQRPLLGQLAERGRLQLQVVRLLQAAAPRKARLTGTDVDQHLAVLDPHVGAGYLLTGKQRHFQHHRAAHRRQPRHLRLDFPLHADLNRARHLEQRRQRPLLKLRRGLAAVFAVFVDPRKLEVFVRNAVFMQPGQLPAFDSRFDPTRQERQLKLHRRTRGQSPFHDHLMIARRDDQIQVSALPLGQRGRGRTIEQHLLGKPLAGTARQRNRRLSRRAHFHPQTQHLALYVEPQPRAGCAVRHARRLFEQSLF